MSLFKMQRVIRDQLLEPKPSDGGAWKFFDDHPKLGSLIDADADTTSVCWSASLLGSLVKYPECRKAFDMIVKALSDDGDIYFDNSGRMDAVALCNMLYFVMLYGELSGIDLSSILPILEHTRNTLIHVIGCTSRKEWAFWLRYYLDESVEEPLLRLGAFLAPLFLRWPGDEFLSPLYSKFIETAKKTKCPDKFSMDTFVWNYVHRNRLSLSITTIQNRPEVIFCTPT